MDHDQLVYITQNHLRNANISKVQKREVYKIIKAFIINNNIPEKFYKISKHENNTKERFKDLSIDLNCLSIDCLGDILCITNYSIE